MTVPPGVQLRRIPESETLEALLHKGPMLVNEIGRRIVTSGSITTAVDRLEARGLVEPSADAYDRRARQVSLTRSSRALITRIFDRHRAVLHAAADGLKRAEREELIALLKKLGPERASEACGRKEERADPQHLRVMERRSRPDHTAWETAPWDPGIARSRNQTRRPRPARRSRECRRDRSADHGAC
jgi:DNA-binding MarR family transcriptional regulator